MRSSPIAVIDSGIGGLSLLKPLAKQFPNENFVYIADNEYMPYGNKSAKTLRFRLLQIIEYLQQNFNIKLVILACNTASVVALDFLRKRCKVEILGLDLNIYSGKSKVICTKQTSKFYPNLNCLPLPRLAKYIEENYFDKRKLEKQINRIVIKNELSATDLVLGCTHYELICNLFSSAITGRLLLPAHDFVSNLKLKHPNIEGGGGIIMLATIPTKSYIDKLWKIYHNLPS